MLKSEEPCTADDTEKLQEDDLYKHWLTAPNGKVIKPVEIWKGRPVYKYEDLLELGPPYSDEPPWE